MWLIVKLVSPILFLVTLTIFHYFIVKLSSFYIVIAFIFLILAGFFFATFFMPIRFIKLKIVLILCFVGIHYFQMNEEKILLPVNVIDDFFKPFSCLAFVQNKIPQDVVNKWQELEKSFPEKIKLASRVLDSKCRLNRVVATFNHAEGSLPRFCGENSINQCWDQLLNRELELYPHSAINYFYAEEKQNFAMSLSKLKKQNISKEIIINLLSSNRELQKSKSYFYTKEFVKITEEQVQLRIEVESVKKRFILYNENPWIYFYLRWGKTRFPSINDEMTRQKMEVSLIDQIYGDKLEKLTN